MRRVVVLLALLAPVVLSGQGPARLPRFISQVVLGEDATSTHYYLAFRDEQQIHRLRYVWNGGCCEAPRVEELVFQNGLFVGLRRFSSTREQLDDLVQGRDVTMGPDVEVPFPAIDLTRPLDPSSGDLLRLARDRLMTYLEHEQEATRLP